MESTSTEGIFLQRPCPGSSESTAFPLDDETRRTYEEHSEYTACGRSPAHFFICQDLAIMASVPMQVDAPASEIGAALDTQVKACVSAGHTHPLEEVPQCIIDRHFAKTLQKAAVFDAAMGVRGCLPVRPGHGVSPVQAPGGGASGAGQTGPVLRLSIKETPSFATETEGNTNGGLVPHGWGIKVVGAPA